MPDSIRLSAPVRPDRYRPEPSLDRFIVRGAPDEEAVPMDVVFVGAGPAGLAGGSESGRRRRGSTSSQAFRRTACWSTETTLWACARLPPGWTAMDKRTRRSCRP